MTEADWLAANRPLKLLRYLQAATDTSDRKLRLFGVACCRRVEEQMSEATLAQVIDGCERLADEFALASLAGLRRTADRVAERAGLAVTETSATESDREHYEYAIAVCQLAEYPIQPEHCADSCMQALCGHDDYVAGHGEMLFQADLLRDIIANPFRPVAFSPAWRTDTTVLLARQMYDARDFSATPIIADALQDAGCDNLDVLNHCRDANVVHVRGCWVVDLVLRNE